MLKQWIILSLVVMTFVQCKSPETDQTADVTEANNMTEPQPNTLTEAEIAEGWKLLFDGQSTDQWRGYNKTSFPETGWTVEDGKLGVLYSGTEEEGNGGDIITVEKFQNYEFQVDFMLTDTANSGILYRVKEVENTPIWHNAPEYQLLDDAAYLAMDAVTPSQLTASNYDMHPATGAKLNPIGEWNTAKIVIQGDQIQHFLNGVKTVDYFIESEEWDGRYESSKFKNYPDYGKTEMGHIGLQDHGHTVWFRNIKIKSL